MIEYEPLEIVEIPTDNPIETHYTGVVEPIELMQAQFTKEEFVGFLKGNIIKYCSRLGKKDNPIREAEKIKVYAEWLDLAIKNKTITTK